ncbi:aminotransferase class IV family protein [Rhodobacter sp. CZR27]|uniref:aminotransferase class IV family protein n=1 Tax=Rhodobacter sp. CZR27 TaxID=2033869 RepID=UPI000BBEAB42|nr:aminotransferase class IV family protein [Rhodobacter sp. CZR27]
MEDPLRDAADDPQLRLIETLLWDGARLAREERHLARLARGAARLGWRCEGVGEALLAAVPDHPARMRVTLDRGGRVEVQAAALPPGRPLWRLGLAAARLCSSDPWLSVKSSRRAAYDAARAALPEGLDEVIFLNERGEVCDGTITTVFFDAGAGLRTPPLAAGLLPGVLREEMLETGACREAGLGAEDLPRVRLWVGNSLRGLIPAVWAGPAVSG